MAEHLESVKALAQDYRKLASENEAENPSRSKRQNNIAEALESVAAELSSARRRLRPIPTSYGDLSDLPDEVLAELNLTKVDELEQQLRDIVASGDGGEVGLDPIIIELYRRHKVVQPRRAIMNKLYRMAQKGLIESVEGRKGVYCIPKSVSANWSAPWDDETEEVPF